MSTHHPSFTRAEQRTFMVQVEQADYKYYPLAAACAVMFPRQGRPSAMTPAWRAHVIALITRGIGHSPEQLAEFDRVYRIVDAALVRPTVARNSGYREGYNDAVEDYSAMMSKAAEDLLSVDESAA